MARASASAVRRLRRCRRRSDAHHYTATPRALRAGGCAHFLFDSGIEISGCSLAFLRIISPVTFGPSFILREMVGEEFFSSVCPNMRCQQACSSWRLARRKG